MAGGLGNDTYVVDNAADTITELAAAGTDTVETSSSYILSANLENLTLTGAAAVNGTGNADANALTGNSANNILDGGAGADAMAGGLGNDTYIVDVTTDVVTEAAASGIDTVQASISYSIAALANVENITLTGITAINATGNAVANSLNGNDAANILNGGTGADAMAGGLGNDTYIVDDVGDTVTEAVAAGIDTVQSSITFSAAAIAELENITLTGTTAINASGNAAANSLTGNGAANVLDGGIGADAMTGGLGNDTYIVDNTADTISEAAAAGTDTVQASISYSIATLANVENITLTGAATINATGNAAANTLTGNAAANLLYGGAGTDDMAGGLGNDTYIVNVATDTVTEAAAAGSDTVQAAVTYSVAALANVENITLTGASAINATGNAAANTLIGNTANNVLIGGASGDVLTGGIGSDTFRFALTDSLLASFDRITDFAIGTDSIDGPVAVSATNLRELGSVTALTQAGIAALLTNATFVANGAATFSLGTGPSARTFLALNNGTAGFSSTTESIIEITGYTGALTSLAVI